jgi:broad specificity phosphatase PhoE
MERPEAGAVRALAEMQRWSAGDAEGEQGAERVAREAHRQVLAWLEEVEEWGKGGGEEVLRVWKQVDAGAQVLGFLTRARRSSGAVALAALTLAALLSAAPHPEDGGPSFPVRRCVEAVRTL